MPGSEFRFGTVQGFNRLLKARRLLTVFVIILFVCSVQIASFHHPDDSLVIHRACHICKYLGVSSSGGESSLLPITTTNSAALFFALENLLIFLAILPLVRSTRAPPHLFLGTQSFQEE
jgi:hypothetical protein